MSARLTLRHIREDDAPALLALYREPSVVRFLGRAPTSEAEERANIRRHRAEYYERRGFGLLAMELPDPEPVLIGRCGLLDSEIAGRPEIEVSWVLAPAYRGRGLATEAARTVLDHAATNLELTRIVAVISPDNVASIRVAERLGMRFDGVVPYKTFGEVNLYVRDT
ncbi:MAG TPA: GNAT family N-acetyltransferase [Gemmatimonadaceae bacterium]|nr:GNAT family N-acetyltransferase [Gemmatimonadaceae bacterium]